MFQIMLITLTAITGLGILALGTWVGMTRAKWMESCRRLVLLIASIPLSLVCMWWISHQLEDQRVI